MKYLYGDSTESPLKRDFLGLLDNFLDTCVGAVKLENTGLALEDDIRERRRLKNSVIEEMDVFKSTIDNAISAAVSKSREKERIQHYADKSKHFLEKFVIEGKREFTDEIHREIAQLNEQIRQVNETNLKTLEPFLIKDPVTITKKTVTLKAGKEGYSAKAVVEYEGDIFAVFAIAASGLEFWKKHVKGVDFLRGVSIPVRMTKPLLKKELEPEFVSIDYYYLTDLMLSGNRLEAVFRKNLNINSERFRLKINPGSAGVEVYHAEENGVEKNLMVIPGLAGALKTAQLLELGELLEKMSEGLFQKRQTLEHTYLMGIDVIEENIVFGLMERIAMVMAPVVSEIKQHTPSVGELSLKAEDDTGKRGEIYLKKEKIREKLAWIGEKGAAMLAILELG